MLKVKSLCLPILANDPWIPGANEEMGLTIKPPGPDEKRKFDNMVVQYVNALSFLRDLSHKY